MSMKRRILTSETSVLLTALRLIMMTPASSMRHVPSGAMRCISMTVQMQKLEFNKIKLIVHL